jgi:nucleotide-binding universal stress UspA family protein
MEYATAEQADLLVLGHSGHSSVWGQFMGTTADKLVRRAAC